jgi:hypothetical protein
MHFEAPTASALRLCSNNLTKPFGSLRRRKVHTGMRGHTSVSPTAEIDFP